jgi:FKBP-type peptidyl-prolyl cis-trans isomerase
MRSSNFAVAVTALALFAPACGAETQAETKPQEGRDRWSYALGALTGKNFTQQGADIDADQFIAGLKAGLAGSVSLSDEELNAAMAEFRTAMQAAQKQKMEAEAVANASAGAKFLAEVAAREGVTKTASGLLYEVIEAGTGATPSASDKVTVHYRGTLIDGSVFDSSYDRGQPATFGVGQVIKGWTEALQLMPTGSKWKLYIPAELAYGERGAPPRIGPGAVLIFDVELISIEGKASS